MGSGRNETGDAGLDRFRAPCRDGRVRRDDQERNGAFVDGARHRRIGRPREALSGIGRQLDLDDDHPDRDVAVEKEKDDIGAVFGRLDLGQIGRDDPRLGVVRKRDSGASVSISGASDGRFLKRSTRISWTIEGMAAKFLPVH